MFDITVVQIDKSISLISLSLIIVSAFEFELNVVYFVLSFSFPFLKKNTKNLLSRI